HALEIVLVHVDRLALFQWRIIGATGVVADEEHLERKLDFLLYVAHGRLVRDVHALLGSDGSLFCHIRFLPERTSLTCHRSRRRCFSITTFNVPRNLTS